MASIGFDSSSQALVSHGTTGTWSHTFSGSNRYLYVLTDYSSNTVTCNGVPLTRLNSNIITYNGGYSFVPGISVWGLANPALGTQTISVTNSSAGGGSGFDHDACIAVSYYNVDPAGPEGYATNQTNGGAVSAQTDYVWTLTDNAWITTFIKGTDNLGRNFTAGASTTLRSTYSNGSFNAASGILDSNGPKTPVNQYSLTTNWSSSTGWFSSITYSLKPYLTMGFTGPSSGNIYSASTNFTITPDVAINGTVTITPTGPGSTGLSPTVLTFSNSATPQTFTITPQAAGVITLTVTNAVGLNNPSPLTYTSNPIAPTAPTIGTAIPHNTYATVSFTDNNDGGSAITNHTATSTPGGFTGTGLTSPITVNGLTNGTGYTFTVHATNAVGNSLESGSSNSVVPYVPASSYTFVGPSNGDVRSASTNFTVTPNSTYLGTVTITPSGPGSYGLSPIVLTWNLSSAPQTFTITPLQGGNITLTSTNSNGITDASPLVYTANPVVPLAPIIGQAFPSISSAQVSFEAPTNDGGSPITLYTITSTPGSITTTTTVPGMVNLLGLTNGTSYTFHVTATNAIGTSAPSSESNAVIPSESSTNFTNSGPKFNIERNVGNIITF